MVSTSPPRSGWSRWGRRLLVAFAVVALAFVVLTLVLSRFLDPEAMAARVEPRLEAALAREVDLEAVDVALFPLGVRLRGLTVADPTGMAPFLARVGSVELRVDLLPLLRREVRVGRLVVSDPQADLRVDEGGRSNFGDFSSQGPPEPSGGEPTGGEAAPAGFALDLRGIRVSGGVLQFRSEEDSTIVDLGNLDVRASVQHDAGGSWVFQGGSDGEVTLGSEGSTPALDRLPLSLEFDLQAGPTFDDLEIRSGSLGVDPLRLSISGRVEGLKESVRNVSLQLQGEDLPLERLTTVLASRFETPLPGQALGLLDASLQVEGSIGPGQTPRVSGTVHVTGGGLEAEDRTLLAQDLSATIDLPDPRRVRFQVAGEVLDGPFNLEGNGTMGGDGTLDFQLRSNPDLSLLALAVELPEGVSARGRVDVDVRGNGSYRDLRSLRVRGQASPNEVHLTHPALAVPVDLPGGTVTLTGTGANFVDFPVTLGNDALSLTGELQNLTSLGRPGAVMGFRGTVRGPRLNLVALSDEPPPDPDLTYGKVAFARLGDRAVAGRSPEEAARELRLARPDSLPVSGELQLALDTLIYAKGRLEAVRAHTEFGPSVFRVTEASMRQFGGEVWTSMNLALGDSPEEPFNLSLRVRDLDAGAFLSQTTPLGHALRGVLSVDLDLAGSLDNLLLPDRPSLVGSGRFSLTNGGLNSVPLTQALSAFMGMDEVRAPEIDAWSASFVLENGRVRLADGRLTGTPGEPVVGGSIGLDGGLDLLSMFEINADNLGTYALENLGIQDNLAGRIPGRPGLVRAIVHLGGTILSPELRGDPGATVRTVTQEVEQQVESEAQRQIQEQRNRLQNRATGFLRNLLRPGDTAAAPPDTTGGDTIRPDTVPPDTIRPDTVRADTVKPDTVRPDTVRPDTVKPDTVRPDTVSQDTSRIRRWGSTRLP